MSTMITVTTAFEIEAFHQASAVPADEQRTLSVTLGLAPEAGTKQMFSDFLEALREVRFFAYRVRRGTGGQMELQRANELLVEVVGAPGGAPNELLGWLDKRSGGSWSIATAPSEGELVGLHQLAAPHLLDAVGAWDAPLPQRVGLVRLLRVKGSALADQNGLVVIPWFAEVSEPDQVLELTGDVTLDGHEPFDVIIPNQPVDPNGQLVLKLKAAEFPVADPTSLVDEGSGFVFRRGAGTGADTSAIAEAALDRALKRLRDGAATQLWAFPALLALDRVLVPLATDENGKPKPPTPDDIQRAEWLALTGLSTLLDPLVIGLTMADTKREGPFVAALCALLESANARDENSVHLPDGWRFQTRRVAEELSKLVLGGFGTGPAEVVTALVATLEIGPLPDAAALNDSPELLPVLLAISSGVDPASFDFAAAVERYGVSLDRQVLAELGVLAKLAQDEAALEAMAKRLLSHAGFNPTWLAGRIEGPALDQAQAERCAAAAISGFWGLLESAFNGLDAARQAMAGLFEAATINAAHLSGKAGGRAWEAEDLKAALVASNWFRRRLGVEPAATVEPHVATFESYADVLCRIVPISSPPNTVDAIGEALDQQLALAAADLFPEEAARRFMPDSVPQDLPVRIGVDADIADGDKFDARFNGVALLVRRVGETWRQANLAEISFRDMAEPPIETIHPLLPVPVDGQRRLMLAYQGLPLAGRDFDHVHVVEQQGDGHHQAFYDIDAPTLDAAERRLPPLVYGVPLEIAAHVVTKSGSLPRAVQYGDAPWLPKPIVDGGKVPEEAVLRYAYQRRTAIGGASLTESPTRGAAPRIGAGLADVVPLASDYPKVSLAASGGFVLRDLLRDTDGSGTISLDGATLAAAPYEARIAEVWKTGVGGRLKVGLWTAPNAEPGDAALAEQAFDLGAAFNGGTLSVRIGFESGKRVVRFTLDRGDGSPPQNGGPVEIPDGEHRRGWVRLVLMGAKVALSWVMPEPDDIVGRAGQKQENLLLVAPAGPKFRPDLAEPVQARIGFPKVGFLDFDRWLSNAAARTKAFPDTGGPGTGEKAARHFQRIAMTAYLGRHKDSDLAALVDAMPDLAVGRLRLTLAPENSIDGAAGTMAPLSLDVPIPPLGTWLGLQTPARPDAPVENVHQTLKRLTDAQSVSVTIGAGQTLLLERTTAPGRPDSVKVSVPPGLVARFGIQTLVDRAWFEADSANLAPMLDPQLKQLASGQVEGFYVFDGSSMVIEAMTLVDYDAAHWQSVAAAAISASADGKARSFGLVATPPHDPTLAQSWRQLGSVSVKTQRWRFSGRPIYSWFDPTGGKRSAQPVVPIVGKPDGLAAFEAEAFFDRDDADAVSSTKQLEPAPTVTRLESFDWELPSATLFRHRMTLRSRYVGALRSPSYGEWQGQNANDWHRVAVLADAQRVQLARPQLRALLPLTESPTEAGAEAESPPILAILDERPFAFGGLADRIATEIRTGFGYGFDATNPDAPVHILDSRKEIGPDPRLSYDPTPGERALALTVGTEGPIGLTFDSATAPAPAFPNSAMLLRPRLAQRQGAGAGALEEHFVSVALRRYLDPYWLVGGAAPDKTALPINTPHWLLFASDLGLDRKEAEEQVPVIGAGSEPLLAIQRKSGTWTIAAAAGRLDTMSSGQVVVATAKVDFAPRLAALHLPLEDGRASLTLFALPLADNADAIATGGGDHPHVLASFDWSVPNGVHLLAVKGVEKIMGTAASPLTQMNWTRTGRAFDMVDLRLGDGRAARRASARLSGRWDGAKLSLCEGLAETRLHLMPQMARDPLFVHRHVALLTSATANGAGRAMERFSGVRRALGTSTRFDTQMSAVRVMTFETLARPLGTASGRDQAEFDLPSIRHEGGAVTGLIFSYRPLGDSLGKRVPTKLHFSFGGGTGFQVSGTGAADKNQLAGVHFTLTTASSGKSKMSWRAVLDDGTSTDGPAVELAMNLAELLAQDKVVVKVAVTPDGEFWGDMSMLSLRDGEGIESFSWDWLFTGGAGLEPREAVTAARLSRMPEAEARIISVSPPIPVKEVRAG